MANQSRSTQERSPKGRGTERSEQPQSGSRAEASSSGVQSAPDSVYGVVSVLYHALQGAETYQKYIADARKSSDDELVQFFEECREEEEERAKRAKSLLLERLEEEDESEEGDEDEDEEDED